jgi:hypothetical protein
MATLRVWPDRHQMMAAAVDGLVTNVAVAVDGTGATAHHAPERLTPSDGAVVVAIRSQSIGGVGKQSVVRVSWVADGQPDSTTAGWI